jgi:phenylacetate-CoA ligase
LKDHGGVMTLKDITEVYAANGKNLSDELKSVALSNTAWNLPFVYVYERSDFSVNLVGAIIYPEEIRRVLLLEAFNLQLTGKFTLEVVQDKRMKSKLIIHTELKQKTPSTQALSNQIQKAIVEALLKGNSEYANNYASYGKEIWPSIKLWPYAHELHFSGKGKQKWVKK